VKWRDFDNSLLVSWKQEAHAIFAVRLYDEGQCRSIIRQASRVNGWSSAEVGGDYIRCVNKEVRAAWIADRAKTAAIHDEFERRISRMVCPAVHRAWGCDFSNCEGTQLVRYFPGGHYVPHKDADEYGYTSRCLTVLCYLNRDFRGGETDFPSLGFRATPVPGKALIFPSRFVHCAEPVLSGEKFILLTWLCGPIPFRWM
jgi:predicted 2-oxoglutarate/Fe(II)-dependent dioxygenase YbiX